MTDKKIPDVYHEIHDFAVECGKEEALGTNLREAIRKVSATEALIYDVKCIQYKILRLAIAKTFFGHLKVFELKAPEERSSIFAPQFDLATIQKAASDVTLDTEAFIQTIIDNGLSYSKKLQSASDLAANANAKP
ncbi:hypothetical protein F4680DRAFT_465461 [Xylaria scruposa]|nr:hypothetical protein F4680DRAFT_465461 [Xylaria scruposa]